MTQNHRALTTLAVALFACAGARAAEAQTIPEIRVGQTVSGTLSTTDPQLTDRGAFQVYRFQAREGERYVSHLRSSAFDAYLSLLRPVGGITEVLRSDDDGGEGTDSRMRFTVPSTGTYYLVAQAFGSGSVGPFTLSLEQAPPPAPVVARPTALGQTHQATLTETDPILEEDESDWEVFHHVYTVQARAGQSLLIAMDSDDFDAYLGFGPMHGGHVQVTDTDDDGGSGTNARLRVTVPADGTYGIQARSFSGGVGGYTLLVREHVPQPVTTRAIRTGQQVPAALSVEDAELDNGAHYQQWTYTGRAGETVRIRMESDEFDTYLALGQGTGASFHEMAANDDDGESTNSFLEFTLPAAGEYVIRATSFGSGATGAYTLRVDSSR
jgi:hypothetical protein